MCCFAPHVRVSIADHAAENEERESTAIAVHMG